MSCFSSLHAQILPNWRYLLSLEVEPINPHLLSAEVESVVGLSRSRAVALEWSLKMIDEASQSLSAFTLKCRNEKSLKNLSQTFVSTLMFCTLLLIYIIAQHVLGIVKVFNTLLWHMALKPVCIFYPIFCISFGNDPCVWESFVHLFFVLIHKLNAVSSSKPLVSNPNIKFPWRSPEWVLIN